MSANSDEATSLHAKMAQHGLQQIEEAIFMLLEPYPEGLNNVEIAKELGLETGGARQKNYLTWSILQEMVTRKTISIIPKPGRKRQVFYAVNRDSSDR
jgi:hypothetical protein